MKERPANSAAEVVFVTVLSAVRRSTPMQWLRSPTSFAPNMAASSLLPCSTALSSGSTR